MKYPTQKVLDRVNISLEKLGSTKKLEYTSRYGYKALDWNNGKVLRTGITNKQAYQIIDAIDDVLEEILYKG